MIFLQALAGMANLLILLLCCLILALVLLTKIGPGGRLLGWSAGLVAATLLTTGFFALPRMAPCEISPLAGEITGCSPTLASLTSTSLDIFMAAPLWAPTVIGVSAVASLGLGMARTRRSEPSDPA